MSDIDDFLIFRGDSGQEAEDFIRAVNIQAFRNGKSRDAEWITTFASAAFAGKALRWYRRLPITTRQDWELLQEAILDNDWEGDKQKSSSAATVPATPPAAAPPIPTSAHVMVSNAPNVSFPPPPAVSNSKRIGRIRVIKEGSVTPSYFVLSSNKVGFLVSSSPENAVVVEWDPSSFPCKLKLVGEDSSHCFFGCQFLSDDPDDTELGPKSKACMILTRATDPQNGLCRPVNDVIAMKNPAKGQALATIWNVLQNGSIVVSMKQHGVTFQLELVAFHDILWLVSDPEAAEITGKVATLRVDTS